MHRESPGNGNGNKADGADLDAGKQQVVGMRVECYQEQWMIPEEQWQQASGNYFSGINNREQAQQDNQWSPALRWSRRILSGQRHLI